MYCVIWTSCWDISLLLKKNIWDIKCLAEHFLPFNWWLRGPEAPSRNSSTSRSLCLSSVDVTLTNVRLKLQQPCHIQIHLHNHISNDLSELDESQFSVKDICYQLKLQTDVLDQCCRQMSFRKGAKARLVFSYYCIIDPVF